MHPTIVSRLTRLEKPLITEEIRLFAGIVQLIIVDLHRAGG